MLQQAKNHIIDAAGMVAVTLPAFAQHEHHQQPERPAGNALYAGHESDHHEGWKQNMGHGHAHDPQLFAEPADDAEWLGHGLAAGRYAHVRLHEARQYNGITCCTGAFTSATPHKISIMTAERARHSKFSVPNWFMGMAQRQVGKNGLLNVRAMVSLDRLFDGGAGYPLLFQSGETWKGEPLINRQHPHDLISELSVAYTQRLSEKIDVTHLCGLSRANRRLARLHLCTECRHSTILMPF
jgi:hypothetical protein